MKRKTPIAETRVSPEPRPQRSPAERMAQAASTGLLLDPNHPEFADLQPSTVETDRRES